MSGTTDVNWKSYVGQINLTITPENYPPCPAPEVYDDILKLSNCEIVEINGLEIVGGREDCIDAVRGRSYLVCNCRLDARVHAITAKGSINGFEIRNTVIREGSEPAIELGQFDNYWYPGRKPTRNVELNYVTSATGRKLRVKVWDSEMPDVNASEVEVTKVPKYIWLPYFLIQYVWVRIKGLKTE